jgi:L-methionine (R)-S-oxide reductase
MTADAPDSRFATVSLRLDELWKRAPARDEALKEVVRVLHEEMDLYHWVGIYVLQGEELVLHNFRGKPTPHERIPVGQGICGAAMAANETVIVDDVKSDDRYLACSLETASEIVVPIRVGKRPVAQLDIDSDEASSFDDADRKFLESVAEKLTAYFADAMETQPGGMKSPFA